MLDHEKGKQCPWHYKSLSGVNVKSTWDILYYIKQWVLPKIFFYLATWFLLVRKFKRQEKLIFTNADINTPVTTMDLTKSQAWIKTRWNINVSCLADNIKGGSEPDWNGVCVPVSARLSEWPKQWSHLRVGLQPNMGGRCLLQVLQHESLAKASTVISHFEDQDFLKHLLDL